MAEAGDGPVPGAAAAAVDVDGGLAEGVSDLSIEDQFKQAQLEMVTELVDAAKKESLDASLVQFGKADSREGFVRFLKQADWNLLKALELMTSACEWHSRNRDNLQGVLRDVYTKQPGLFSLRQVGFDKEGRPLLFLCFHQNSATAAEHTVDAVISFSQQIAENAGRTSKQQGTEESGRTIAVVVDCGGLQPKALLQPTMLVKAHQTLTLLYPHTISSVLLFNYSPEVRDTWKKLRSYLDDDLAGKVKFVASLNANKTLTTTYPPDVSQWLKEEMAANKTQPLPDAQQHFWLPNQPHDPRGALSYVAEFLSGKRTAGYEPHPGIMYGKSL